MKVLSKQILNPRRILPLVAMALILMMACKNEKKVSVASQLNPKKMPTMATTNVSTLISDSGIIQYKLVSPAWYVYNEVDTPYWYFPKGIYLRKYDRSFKVISSVAADSARYLSLLKIWKLDGHVEIHNGTDELFLTNQLFWDERRHKLYSDSFIHIETESHILEGRGFVSNERLTQYRILKPTGVFPVNQQQLEPGTPAEVPTTLPTPTEAIDIPEPPRQEE
ncbi:MAG: LPS export ABC transporter periplasmic protein LptC [Prevotella sp.]|nr:LPS export ABC transporter periplasmic protein LptC [Bacteroides sp.]MCM1366009.1 LPS export ABC transporter periplasmic protein LptC [Prevotella sp.]MCM1436921.1 LPS export ABC transporter periplasmic protein LptC [Prevotella sp.]